jgi:hypothetical protein
MKSCSTCLKTAYCFAVHQINLLKKILTVFPVFDFYKQNILLNSLLKSKNSYVNIIISLQKKCNNKNNLKSSALRLNLFFCCYVLQFRAKQNCISRAEKSSGIYAAALTMNWCCVRFLPSEFARAFSSLSFPLNHCQEHKVTDTTSKMLSPKI